MKTVVQKWGSWISISSCLLLLPLVGVSRLSADVVDFEDGAGHDVVIPSQQYAGLTISNAVWIRSGQQFHDGNYGLGVDAGVVGHNNWAFPGTTSPIVIEFDQAVATVAIDVFDVEDRGARLAAFDSHGALLGADSVSATVGSPIDVTLGFSGQDIRRIELSQLVNNTNNGDGIGWDNLSFTSVPEPGASALVGIGLMAMALRRRRQRLI